MVPLIGPVAGAAFITTVKLTGAAFPQTLLCVQEMTPPVVVQLTEMELVPCPEAIVAPAGTVHVKTLPALFVTE